MKSRNFTYASLIDDAKVNIAMEHSEILDAAKWALGDLVLDILEDANESGQKVQVRDVCKAVGAFTGLRSQQVMELAAVSLAFPDKSRELDGRGVLFHGHFQRAYESGSPDEALKWCLDQIVELGRPATVDALTVVFKPGKKVATAEELSEPLDAPTAVIAARKTARRNARRLIRLLVSDLEQGKLGVDLPDGFRNTLETLIEKLA